ncbi:ferredoxin [Streptomyces longispororuber]|uniref:ferredoxin n=1 Tax=Streptomyces TaxID=1883 RepID=UPI0024A98113|nr:ferredoxin [Streptomyces sp. CC224B]
MTAPSKEPWCVKVDTSLCMGSGMCEGIAPDYFQLVDNRAQPTRPRVGQNDLVLEASESCPAEAILVRDERTGTVIAPREH